MDPVQFKLTADAAPILASLDNVADAMKGIQTEYEKTKKAGKELFAPTTESALKEVEAIDLLQKEYSTLEKASKTLKSALSTATDSKAIAKYTAEVVKAEAGLAQLRDVAKKTGVQFKSLDGDVDKAGKSIKKLNDQGSIGTEVFEGLFGSLAKAAVIVAVVQAVAAFTKELVTFAVATDRAEKQFKNFVGGAENAKKVVAELNQFSIAKSLDSAKVLDSAKSLLAFGESGETVVPVLSRIADLSAGTGKDLKELSVLYGKARVAGVLMAEDINQLVDAGIPIITEFANQMGVTERDVKKLASESKISFAELELALFNLTKQGADFYNQSAVAAATLPGMWEKSKANLLAIFRPLGNGIKTFLTDYLENFNTAYNVTQKLLSDPSSFLELSKVLKDARAEAKGIDTRSYDERVEEYSKNQAEQKRLEEAAAASRLAAGKEAAAKEAAARRKEAEKRQKELEAIEKQKAQLRANLTEDETERQVALERIKYDALTGELKKYFKAGDELNGLLLKAQTDFEDNVSGIRAKALLKRLEFDLEAEEVRKKDLQRIADATTEQALAVRAEAAENAKVRRDVTLENIAIAKEEGQRVILELKRQGASEDKVNKAQLVLDAETQVARLQAELQFQKDLLAITDATDTERLAAINRQIDLLGKQIGNAVEGLEIDTAPGKGFLSKFIDSLGLSPDDVNILQDAAAKIVGAISDITAARVNDADVALRVAEDRVAAAEDALSREIELGEAGFASNVGNAQLALEAAKKAEAQVLEEKKKAAKAQLAIDSALQASAIATSAAQLVKTWATLPFGVGLIAAAAQVAGLFAFLAGVRSKAKAIAQFGEGGEAGVDGNSIVTGPSHAGGGVGINVEGGEFMTSDGKKLSIVKKKMTKKHFAILKAVNSDNVPEIGRLAAELVQSRAASARLDPTAGQRVSASVAAGATQRQEVGSSALREQNALLRENNRLLGKIYGKNDGTVKVGNTTVITKGNQTTILRG